MLSEPITLVVNDDVAPGDVEHWLPFDEADLQNLPPLSIDPGSQVQPSPDSPFFYLDSILADPRSDAPRSDHPAMEPPGEPVSMFDHGPREAMERPNELDGNAHSRESGAANADGIREPSTDLSSFVDLIDSWESSMRHSNDSATYNECQEVVPDAGNVIEAGNLDLSLPVQASPSTWHPDQSRNVDAAQQHGFAATSSSVLHALQPDGFGSQVLTFEEASERLFVATAPAPLQNPTACWTQTQTQPSGASGVVRGERRAGMAQNCVAQAASAGEVPKSGDVRADADADAWLQHQEKQRPQILSQNEERQKQLQVETQHQTHQSQQQQHLQSQQQSQPQSQQQAQQQPSSHYGSLQQQETQQQQQQQPAAIKVPLFQVASDRCLPSSSQHPSTPQLPSTSRRTEMGVGGIRAPPSDLPSAPPPSKLPRRPPDLSNRLAAVLHNINPPRTVSSARRPSTPPVPYPGLGTTAAAAAAAGASPAAPSSSVSAAGARPFAIAAPVATAPVSAAAAARVAFFPGAAPGSLLVAGRSVSEASASVCPTAPSPRCCELTGVEPCCESGAAGQDGQGRQQTLSYQQQVLLMSQQHLHQQQQQQQQRQQKLQQQQVGPPPPPPHHHQNHHQQQQQQQQQQPAQSAAVVAWSESDWSVVQQALKDMLSQLNMLHATLPHTQPLLQNHSAPLHNRTPPPNGAAQSTASLTSLAVSQMPFFATQSPAPEHAATLEASQNAQRSQLACFRPEKPLRVDFSGHLPLPMSGAREAMLKQQLAALAEAMAVDDSVRWRYFMRKLRREASAGGDTLQRIAFHAIEALESRMDGSALCKWRTPMKISIQDSMEVLGHGSPHGVPAFIQLANIAAVQETLRAFTQIPPPHTTAPSRATPSSVWRRRFHIIAIGFYGGPHWINILMRLAAHYAASPLPSASPSGSPSASANGHAPSGASSGPTTSSAGGSTHAMPHTATPHIKVTAVDFGIVKLEEHPTGLVHLGGQYLEQVASMLGLSLSFHGIETTPYEFHPSQVEVDQGEEVVVLANWGLMVFPDDSVLRSNPRNAILKWIRDLRPLLLLQVDIDLEANGPFFLSRFHAAFANFAAFVESFDCSMPHAAAPRHVAETILARDLMNGIACEGTNRWLRAERLEKWVHRMRQVGLEPVAIGPDTVAAGREVTVARDGRFRVEVHAETGALQLSWRGVPMIFVAAWR